MESRKSDLEGLDRVDSKFRADNFAVMAVHTVIRFTGLRWVIPFFVKAVGEGEYMHRTKFNAVSTAFAPVFNNSHQTFRDVDLLGVQGLSPECHICFPE